MEEFEHLRGKVLIAHNCLNIPRVRVLDVDRDVGISIVNEDDHDEYVFCIYGPTAFKARTKGLEHPEPDKYTELFNIVVKDIEDGIYDETHHEQVESNVTSNKYFIPSSNTCPFNQ